MLALAVNANTDHVLLIDFEFEPSTTAWNDLGGPDVFIGRFINRALEVDARRTDELRNYNALGAVNNKSAAWSHQREVAHENGLALNFTSGVVHELCRQEERCGVGDVALFAFVDRVLRWFEAVIAE
ncbi:unannotated protein [freshwater metagenome]|uniref:Unannotated protein n=1 Tax=freshwater metagenome TaxID=449393 RepID=A0A6J7G7R5_9ZZZZ